MATHPKYARDVDAAVFDATDFGRRAAAYEDDVDTAIAAALGDVDPDFDAIGFGKRRVVNGRVFPVFYD
jgi:hypothetical protein